jgi:hypothetical protein
MKIYCALALTVLALCVYQRVLGADNSDRVPADSAAMQGLKQLQESVETMQSRSKSVPAPEDLKRAKLERPLPVYAIDQELLAHYTAEKNPKTILHNYGHLFLYPVSVDGQAVAMLEISQNESGQWSTGEISFGHNYVTGVLNAAKKLAAESAGQEIFSAQDMFANIYLVGRIGGDDVVFVPVVDNGDFGLKSGTPVSARKLFATLSSKAIK